METKKNVAFVMMLDCSGSMYSSMPLVKIDAKAFVRYCFPQDQFAVNRFESHASWLYPTDGSMTTVVDKSQIEKACAAIDTLRAGDNTNMAEAVSLAQQAIAGATLDRKVFVLLSDGCSNVGEDPDTVYTGRIPLFIASIGTFVSVNMFRKLKAKNSENEIYFQPSAYEMMRMFNSIRGDVTGSSLLVNSMQPYAGSDYQLEEVVVSRDEPLAQFSVVWDDARCRYTDGIPHQFQFNVFLIDPDGNRLPDRPDVVSDGCCIFNRTNVKAGKWYILVQYSVEGGSAIHGTIGGFLFKPSLRLSVEVPRSCAPGEALTPVLTVWDGDRKVEDVSAKVRVVSPTAASEALFRAAASAAGDEKRGRWDSPETCAEETRRLVGTLHREVHLIRARNGEMKCCIPQTQAAGPYNLECEVNGIDPATGKEFRMVRTKTVLVAL